MKKFLVILLFLVLSLSTGPVLATDYHINFETGSESNDGTMGSPWKYWPADTRSTNGGSIACGNTYLFARGVTYRGTVFINNVTADCDVNNRLVIDAYGSGHDPVITSRRRSQATWSGPDAGGDYAIDVDETYPQAFWAGDYPSIWGGEVFYCNCGSNPPDGAWGISGNRTINYDPGPGQAIPNNPDFFFDYGGSSAGELSGIEVANSIYVEIRNIDLLRSRQHGIKVWGSSSHIYMYDINADYNGVSDNYMTSGSYESIGNGIEIGGGSNMFVYDSSANYNIDNGLTVEKIGGTGVTDVYFYDSEGSYNGSSGGSLKGGSSTTHEAYFYKCKFMGNGNDGVDGTHYSRSGIKVKWGQIELWNSVLADNVGAGIEFIEENPGTANVIAGNLIYNNNTGDWVGNENGQGTCGTGPCPQSGNNSGIHIFHSFWRTSTFKIYNNTIANFGTNNQDHAIWLRGTGGNSLSMYDIKNNIMYNHVISDLKIDQTDTSGGGLDIGYTMYNDPEFIDHSADDYRLTDNSPCRDAGTDLGTYYNEAFTPSTDWSIFKVTLDNQGNYGSGWEIGSYIYNLLPPADFRIVKL